MPQHVDSPATLPPRPSEQFLMQLTQDDALTGKAEGRGLTWTLGRAQLAQALALQNTVTHVDCLFHDLYLANQTSNSGGIPDNLEIQCRADPSPEPYQIAMLPLSRRGESELALDLLQSFYNAIELGGWLWVAVDNPTDRWVRTQLERFSVSIVTKTNNHCTSYGMQKVQPLAKQKDYRCQFAFRDRGKLLQAVSRPGVFSHRRIDPGARHLINRMDIKDASRVIDIGCGCGTVSIAAAAANSSSHVYAIDSHIRAIECTRRSAELNDLAQVSCQLTECGELSVPGSFDLALANPPYYANFRIATLFLDTAYRALRPGGRVHVVGKQDRWYHENMCRWFADVQIDQIKGYIIASGTRP